MCVCHLIPQSRAELSRVELSISTPGIYIYIYTPNSKWMHTPFLFGQLRIKNERALLLSLLFGNLAGLSVL